MIIESLGFPLHQDEEKGYVHIVRRGIHHNDHKLFKRRLNWYNFERAVREEMHSPEFGKKNKVWMAPSDDSLQLSLVGFDLNVHGKIEL